jgi:hypothetical protein
LWPLDDVIDVPLDMPETDDLAVATELTDSLDPLRVCRLLIGGSEGRLGGKLGAGGADVFLGGNVGPMDACDVREGNGGRAATMPFCEPFNAIEP